MALTDVGLDALRAGMYQGLCDSKAKADEVSAALQKLQHGTMEYHQANNQFYSYCGEVEAWSRALYLLDQARRSAPRRVAR